MCRKRPADGDTVKDGSGDEQRRKRREEKRCLPSRPGEERGCRQNEESHADVRCVRPGHGDRNRRNGQTNLENEHDRQLRRMASPERTAQQQKDDAAHDAGEEPCANQGDEVGAVEEVVGDTKERHEHDSQEARNHGALVDQAPPLGLVRSYGCWRH